MSVTLFSTPYTMLTTEFWVQMKLVYKNPVNLKNMFELCPL